MTTFYVMAIDRKRKLELTDPTPSPKRMTRASHRLEILEINDLNTTNQIKGKGRMEEAEVKKQLEKVTSAANMTFLYN